jgi:hypothetical protein
VLQSALSLQALSAGVLSEPLLQHVFCCLIFVQVLFSFLLVHASCFFSFVLAVFLAVKIAQASFITGTKLAVSARKTAKGKNNISALVLILSELKINNKFKKL